MKLDLSSFLLGCGVGASALLLGRQLRPLVLEVATIIYRVQERVMAATPMGQEALAVLLAEARARACLRAGPTLPSDRSTPSPAGSGTG